MHLLSGWNGHQFCIRPGYLLVPEAQKEYPKPTLSFASFSPQTSFFPNQLTSTQNIFVILTLTVKAILILNKTMLARPEF